MLPRISNYATPSTTSQQSQQRMGSSIRKNDSSGISGIFGGGSTSAQTMQRNAQNILGNNPYEESPAYKKLQNQGLYEPASQDLIDQSLDCKIDEKLEEIDKILARNPQPVNYQQQQNQQVEAFQQVSIGQQQQQQYQRGQQQQYRVTAPFMTDPSLDPIEEPVIQQQVEEIKQEPAFQQQQQEQWEEEQEIPQPPKKKEEKKELKKDLKKPPLTNKQKIQEVQNQAKQKRLNSVQKRKEDNSSANSGQKTSMTGLPMQKKNSLLSQKRQGTTASRQQTLKERQQNKDLEEIGSEFQTQEEEIPQSIPQQTRPPVVQKAQISSQQQKKDDDLDQTYHLQVQISALERQLNTRTSENQKLKKKVQKLEKQLEESQKESSQAPNLFKEAINKSNSNIDERRVMLLKGQNSQLTRQVNTLNRILKQQRETTIELDALLDQLMSFQVSKDPEIVKQRIPKIADQAKQMRQRLQVQLNSDRRQFNKQHLDCNPLAEEMDEEEDGLRFDKEKVFQCEEKLTYLLKDCLTLCLNTFSKDKMPKEDQLQGFCQDLREAIESLLFMGIGLEPSKERNQQNKALKQFVQKKFSDKLELKTHLIDKSSDKTQIFTKTLETKLINLVLPRNEQKVKEILSSIQHQELSYWIELYLKELELRINRKVSDRAQQSSLQKENWVKRKVNMLFSTNTLSTLIEAFRDFENCEDSEVRLMAVYKQHKDFISRALEDIESFLEIGSGERVEDSLLREFDDYIKSIN